MRDINSVMSSSFVIGRAIIESDADAEITRDVATHGSRLRIATKPTSVQVAELEIKEEMATVELRKAVTQLVIEAYRIKIVAKKEEADLTQEYATKDANWDLEVFQYGVNVMAGAAGGTAIPGDKKISAGSMIGGALSGAAAGGIAGSIMGGTAMGMAAGPFGAIAGGLLGLGMGLLG